MKDNTYLFSNNINLHQSKTNSYSSIFISYIKISYLQNFNQFKYLLSSILIYLLLMSLLMIYFFILIIILIYLIWIYLDYSNIMKIWMNIKLHEIILYNSILSSISSQQIFLFDKLNQFLIHSKFILISQKLIILIIQELSIIYIYYIISIYK